MDYGFECFHHKRNCKPHTDTGGADVAYCGCYSPAISERLNLIDGGRASKEDQMAKFPDVFFTVSEVPRAITSIRRETTANVKRSMLQYPTAIH